jgi:hypothetical protein
MEPGALQAVLQQTNDPASLSGATDDETVVRSIGTRELMELVAPAPAPSPAQVTSAPNDLPTAAVAPRWLFEPSQGSSGPTAGDLFGHMTGRPPASWFDIRRPDPREPGHGFGDGGQEVSPAPVAVTATDAARCFDRGLELVEGKQYAQALIEWERACALEPHNRTYQGNLKRLRRRVGQQAHPLPESQ